MNQDDLSRAERVIRATIDSHGALDALGYALQLLREVHSLRSQAEQYNIAIRLHAFQVCINERNDLLAERGALRAEVAALRGTLR